MSVYFPSPVIIPGYIEMADVHAQVVEAGAAAGAEVGIGTHAEGGQGEGSEQPRTPAQPPHRDLADLG